MEDPYLTKRNYRALSEQEFDTQTRLGANEQSHARVAMDANVEAMSQPW